MNDELAVNPFALFLTATIFANIIITTTLIAKKEISFSNFSIHFISAGIMIIFFLYRTVKYLSIRQNLRPGYFGELVTAEALNKLMPEGNHVFHDFQADHFNDTTYLEQAKRQAKWLSTWLKSAIGEPVDVFPIISLPGFYVERKAPPDGMFVINPKQMKTVIRSKIVKNLDESKILRIIRQLDQKCRDLEIISKQYDAKSSPVSG
jgi:hypothetical protein